MSRPDRPPLLSRIRYAVDNALAQGVATIAVWLGVVTVAVIVAAGLVLRLGGIRVNDGSRAGFVEGLWLSLQRTLDPGTGGNDVGWAFRAISLTVTLTGIFVVTALIGLTANGIDRKLEQLRRGRSTVVEREHTLILGWSPKLATILPELVEANRSLRRAAVVVLAAADKQEMDNTIRRWAPNRRTTRVVCRTGFPYDLQDLALVSPQWAKSVIVLADESDPSGAGAVKAVLALLRSGVRPETPLIVEVPDSKRARALEQATDGRVVAVVSSDIIARITAQVCRQSGLSVVFQELLGFDGDELYFGTDPRLAGLTFEQVVLAYDTSSVIGVRAADGTVELVPPMDRVMRQGDGVVAIARDDVSVVFGAVRERARVPLCLPSPVPTAPERTLVLGWNDMGPGLLRELDAYAMPGACVRVLVDPRYADPPAQVRGVEVLDVRIDTADTADEEVVAELFADARWDHVIVLCYHRLPVGEADARTLLTLLEIQHAIRDAPRPASVVAELLDIEDVDLAPDTAADDFIVSERLTSFVLSQLSENPALDGVLTELLSAGGAELAICAIGDAGPLGRRPYRDLVAAAACNGEVAIGYRAATAGRGAPVRVNPPKDELLDVSAGDQLVVVRVKPPAEPPKPKRRARKAAAR